MTSKTFALTGPINLTVRAAHGSVTILAQDGLREATVDITAADPSSPAPDQISVELEGPTLTVLAPRQGGLRDLPMFAGRAARDAVDITITVPSDTAIKASSFTATVTGRGRTGGVDVGAGSAQVEFDHVAGDLRIRLGHGEAHVTRVDGSVEFRSGAGNARFGEVKGAINSATGRGTIAVATARGAVRARTGSGRASLGAIYDSVDVTSGAGALEIGVPSGLSARVDATTGSGTVNSDFPVDKQPVRDRLRKTINVRARTGSGDIRLFRSA